jgi:Fe-S-cluster containining protein
MSAELDCRRCGACCKNLPSNRAEGFASWVEVDPDDDLLADAELVRRHVVVDDGGVAHLRLAPDGRCLALRGALGDRVRCTLYHLRPSPCRRVQPGDDLCRRYRAEHGIRDSVPAG